MMAQQFEDVKESEEPRLQVKSGSQDILHHPSLETSQGVSSKTVWDKIIRDIESNIKREVEAQEAKGRPKTTKLAGEEIKNETKPGIPEPAE